MATPPSPPEVLLRAAARARALRGRVRVVKLGGSAMEDPVATRGTLEGVVCLQMLGVRQVLVHGGGKPIDRTMAAAGLEPRKVAGRRYTDEETLEVVVRVLREINKGIEQQLREFGAQSIPPIWDAPPKLFPVGGEKLVLNGPDGRPIDLGRVGKPTRVESPVLDAVVKDNGITILPCLAADADGGWLNVNADTQAAAVAGALKAEACLFLTDTPGVLRDVRDPGSLIPRLTRAECERLIRDGVIAGGMVPKVEACFEALDAGAGRAVILDGRDPYALLREFTGEPGGTEIVL